jgi:hypothetical protein
MTKSTTNRISKRINGNSKKTTKSMNLPNQKLITAGFFRLSDNDPILSLSDIQLRKSVSSILSPQKIRFERMKFILKNSPPQYGNPQNQANNTTNQTTQPLEDDFSAIFSLFFSFRPLPVSVESLKSHCYIGAASGHGKSELIKRLAYGLMQHGKGVIILDPHGELALQVAQWKEFANNPQRLVYFAPKLASDSLDIVPIINPLASLYKAPNLDSAVENFMAVMVAVVGEDSELSTRMKNLLKPCLYTLATHENATIYDIFDFLGDDEKGRAWIEKAKNTLTNKALVSGLDVFFETSYKTTKSSIRDRLRALLSSDGLDRCLASGANSIDLKEAMDNGKVIVFNLAGMGADTCGAFGRFIVGTVQNIAMERHEIASHQRKPVFMFLDEADRFISDAVVDIYKETRKYGLHLGIVQQITGFNMKPDTYRAIIGNSRVRFSGNAGGDKQTAIDLAEHTGTTKEDIRALPPLHFLVQEKQKPAKRFCLMYDQNGATQGAELLGNNNSMTPKEWQAVKQFQISQYYRKIGNGYTQPHEPAAAQKTPPKAPLNTDPIDFYG